MSTIMVLDDKQIYRDLFAVFFEKHGFQTVMAGNAATPVASCKNFRRGMIPVMSNLRQRQCLDRVDLFNRCHVISKLADANLVEAVAKNDAFRAEAIRSCRHDPVW